MDSSADSATASAGDPKSKEWQDEVKAAGSLPGSKNVRHKSHAFGDPDKLRYQKVFYFRCQKLKIANVSKIYGKFEHFTSFA